MSLTDPEFTAIRDALPGLTLDGTEGARYFLGERIGEGTQGWVFRASWDDPEGATVIVKILRPDAAAGMAMKRFVREAEVLRQLSQTARANPYIVRYYDHSIAEISPPGATAATQLPFTVMEYVNGATMLRALHEARGVGLPVARVRRLLRHVVKGLETVHKHGIVHRDLKPSNIMITQDFGGELAKVTDFGLVKMVNPDLRYTTALAGASLGYAPPEQFEQGNDRVSPRTDVFSLAAILYETLACRRAFRAAPDAPALQLVLAVINGPRPSLVQSVSSLSPEARAHTDVLTALDVEIHKALKADPDARHASVTEFWAAVEPLLRALTG